MKFSIRDILWLTFAVALAVGWWIDRSRLAIPAGEYRLLKAEAARKKAEEAQLLMQHAMILEAMRKQSSRQQTAVERLGPDGLRLVSGDKDYQFPPNYPLYYGPVKRPTNKWEEG